MNRISFRIVGDSVNPAGVRLISGIAVYPRFIHSELMTHRNFSRNAASSRAISFSKNVRMLLDDPACPVRWGIEKKGMQIGLVLHERDAEAARADWLAIRDEVIERVTDMKLEYDIHKSILNRALEPWSWMTTLVTTAHPANFRGLRCHEAAEPQFQILAYAFNRALNRSKPRRIGWGEWHLPVFDNMDDIDFRNPSEEDLKVVAARCGRLSYLTQDGEHSREKDLATADKFMGFPMHASPTEHLARAVEDSVYPLSNFDSPTLSWEDESSLHINVDGLSHWLQYRKTFAHERITEVDGKLLEENEPQWVREYLDANG